MSQLLTNYQEFVRKGVDKHLECKFNINAAKLKAFEAGVAFKKAKQLCPEGEWLETLEIYGQGVPTRTVQHYMRFTEECMLWAQAQNPNLLDQEKLLGIAKNMVLESAGTFMDLCRDLGAIAARPANGARDGKGAREPRQTDFVFNFDSFDFGLMAVERSEGNPFLSVPREELQLSRHRAAMALELIDEALKTEAVNALVEVTSNSVAEIV